nr:MAG TPA: hypothetical protein [Caudoviricetes sp.]
MNEYHRFNTEVLKHWLFIPRFLKPQLIKPWLLKRMS